jgi:hypothetical protein
VKPFSDVAGWIRFVSIEELLSGRLQNVGRWHSCKVSRKRSEWCERSVHVKGGQEPPWDSKAQLNDMSYQDSQISHIACKSARERSD